MEPPTIAATGVESPLLLGWGVEEVVTLDEVEEVGKTPLLAGTATAKAADVDVPGEYPGDPGVRGL